MDEKQVNPEQQNLLPQGQPMDPATGQPVMPMQQPMTQGMPMQPGQPMMQQPGQPMMQQPGQPMPGQPMMQQPGQPVVVVAPGGSFPVNHWPDHPVTVTCQYCGHTGMTHCVEEKGTLAWILCLVLCLVGCWLGCCMIPFCIPACNDHQHTCTHCHKPVGYHKSM